MKNLTTKSYYECFKDKSQPYHCLWHNGKYLGYTKAQWIEMYNQDPHLNQLGNAFYDKYFPIFHSPSIASLSDNICALKHYIIYSVIEAEPKFLQED